MAATPKNAVFQFLGLQSRGITPVDVYCSDVANAMVNWDSGNGAGSTSDLFWIAPEASILYDISIVTGMADTTKLQTIINGMRTGKTHRYDMHVSTSIARPKLNIFVPRGAKIAAIQLA